MSERGSDLDRERREKRQIAYANEAETFRKRTNIDFNFSIKRETKIQRPCLNNKFSKYDRKQAIASASSLKYVEVVKRKPLCPNGLGLTLANVFLPQNYTE